MISSIKSLIPVSKKALKDWWARDPFNSSIIVAYYTIFSLPGLLVIVINVAGYFFGKDAVTEEVSMQIGGLIGPETAKDIEGIATKASESKGTTISTILSVATLLFGATGVFYHVQQIFNKIWEVKPKPKERTLQLIKDRLFSFGLVLVVGFLLLVSLLLSAALAAASDWVGDNISEGLTALFAVLDFLLSMAVITALFAAMFKFLPDAKIEWKDVWAGAILTAVLFTIAKFALGFYFGKSDPSSAYGAAGSVVLIMLWVSYAGLILFLGAEFTKVYSQHHGRNVKPTEVARATNQRKERGADIEKRQQKTITKN